MQDQPWNPYTDTAASDNSNMFYGRRKLLRRIFSAVANRQSVSLVGSRRIGKSAVLRCMRLIDIQQEFEIPLDGLIFVPLDLQTYLLKSTEDFFSEVSEQILCQSCDLHMIDPAHLKGASKFSTILRQIEELDYHPVLLMDGFDSLVRSKCFDLDFFSFLRSQATLGLVSYVTATVAPLSEVCHNDIKTSPFFNVFSVQYVGPLSLEEARQFITEPMEQAGISVNEKDIQWVLKLAGRHPYFVQRVCHVLFEEKNKHSGMNLDLKHCERVAYQDLMPLFSAIWDSLGKEMRELVRMKAARSQNEHDTLLELNYSALMYRFVREKLKEEQMQDEEQ